MGPKVPGEHTALELYIFNTLNMQHIVLNNMLTHKRAKPIVATQKSNLLFLYPLKIFWA
jgi:hypothetical protein